MHQTLEQRHDAPRHLQDLHVAGVGPGVPIMTDDGEIPVELLGPGDRIVTRSGYCELLGVQPVACGPDRAAIAPGALGRDLPASRILVGLGTGVHLTGDINPETSIHPQAIVPARTLVRHGMATPVRARTLLFALVFERAENFYAAGTGLSLHASLLTSPTISRRRRH